MRVNDLLRTVLLNYPTAFVNALDVLTYCLCSDGISWDRESGEINISEDPIYGKALADTLEDAVCNLVEDYEECRDPYKETELLSYRIRQVFKVPEKIIDLEFREPMCVILESNSPILCIPDNISYDWYKAAVVVYERSILPAGNVVDLLKKQIEQDFLKIKEKRDWI